MLPSFYKPICRTSELPRVCLHPKPRHIDGKVFSTNHFLPSLPGFSVFPHWFNNRIDENLCTDQFVAVPDAKEIEKARESFWEKSPCGFMYVKLHGSYGWRSTNGADKMIIGHANWEGLPVSLFSSGICRYSR